MKKILVLIALLIPFAVSAQYYGTFMEMTDSIGVGTGANRTVVKPGGVTFPDGTIQPTAAITVDSVSYADTSGHSSTAVNSDSAAYSDTSSYALNSGSGGADSLYHKDSQTWLTNGDTIPLSDSTRQVFTATEYMQSQSYRGDTAEVDLVYNSSAFNIQSNSGVIVHDDDTVYFDGTNGSTEGSIKSLNTFTDTSYVNTNLVVSSESIIREDDGPTWELPSDATGLVIRNDQYSKSLFYQIRESVNSDLLINDGRYDLSSESSDVKNELSLGGVTEGSAMTFTRVNSNNDNTAQISFSTPTTVNESSLNLLVGTTSNSYNYVLKKDTLHADGTNGSTENNAKFKTGSFTDSIKINGIWYSNFNATVSFYDKNTAQEVTDTLQAIDTIRDDLQVLGKLNVVNAVKLDTLYFNSAGDTVGTIFVEGYDQFKMASGEFNSMEVEAGTTLLLNNSEGANKMVYNADSLHADGSSTSTANNALFKNVFARLGGFFGNIFSGDSANFRTADFDSIYVGGYKITGADTSNRLTGLDLIEADTAIVGGDTILGAVDAQTAIESIEFDKLMFDTALVSNDTITSYEFTQSIRKILYPNDYASYLPNDSVFTTPSITLNTPTKVLIPTAIKYSRNWNLYDKGGSDFALRFEGADSSKFHITMTTSMTTSINNVVFEVFMYKNGVLEPGIAVERKMGTGADVGAISVTGVFDAAQNDYIEVYILVDITTTVTFSKTSIVIKEDGLITN